MSTAVFYHNPKCSKSRQILAFVREQVEEVKVIEYIKNPRSKLELEDIYKKLDILSTHQMIRDQEDEFSKAGLSETSKDDDVLAAIAKYPRLLERPIVVYKNRAAIGRNLDHVVALLLN
ncbi:arsenate reductase [Glaciecola punicea ACAM 611]|jgi:arsenate reductase|uniref:Arsenate reductase n=1 Tax=Glaciecola punicea ACAM 611 TaxID=1121923 RepID=H5TA14_9ALTE|nr:arsenate reductase (glutaredoxin) [Glaciecola punicea]GAB55141.1 arsenate reductase [Glaciecola punicea ACAM 611]